MVGGNGGGRMAILILELNCRKGKRVKVEEKCVFLGTELISGWRINFHCFRKAVSWMSNLNYEYDVKNKLIFVKYQN